VGGVVTQTIISAATIPATLTSLVLGGSLFFW
jgi:hypothetical protein